MEDNNDIWGDPDADLDMELESQGLDPYPSKEEMDETMREAQKIISQLQKDAIDEFTMYMKFNYLLNIIAGHKDDEVNWEEVNKILSMRNEFDFNMFDEIRTIQELVTAREDCVEAPVFDGPWQEHKCKDCKKRFVMSYPEVMYFKDHDLHIPKRCPECRAKRKKV